jgi:regulator of sirC expression with transglutaminase-like and TPR domain
VPVLPFAELAAEPEPPLDAVALALAAEFRPVDAAAAMATLDALGARLARACAATDGSARAQAHACASLLGTEVGFAGDAERYDEPRNSMLDIVLERRRGLPILLSVVYVEVARRAGVPLAGIGLPGHFVVGHVGTAPPLLLDPFAGGAPVAGDAPGHLVRPWGSLEIAMRMLNNLVGAYQRRGNVAAALRAAEMRLLLPADEPLHSAVRTELRGLQARLN